MAVTLSKAPLFTAFLVVLLTRNLNDFSVFIRGTDGLGLNGICMRNWPYSMNTTYDTVIPQQCGHGFAISERELKHRWIAFGGKYLYY